MVAAGPGAGSPSPAPRNLAPVEVGARWRVLAWSLWALTVLLAVAYGVLAYLDRSVQLHVYGYLGAVPLATFAFATIGAIVAARYPRNPVGWIFLTIGTTLLLTSDAQLYAIRGIIASPGSFPFAVFAGWLGSWFWGPGVGMTVVLVPLLFPDGRPPRGRLFSYFAWLAAAVLVFQAIAGAYVFLPGPGAHLDESGQFALLADDPKLALFGLVYTAIVPVALVSVISLVVRRRRAGAEERQQLKFIAYAGVIVLIGVAGSGVGNTLSPGGGTLYDLSSIVFVTSFLAVPIAAGLAILRYRLYDIDVVISRTIVYGVMAAVITVVYVVIVAGVGSLIHSAGGNNLLLSIVATAVVAVAFQPLRTRLQRVANRVVYGRQATPYEVLSSFSEGVAETYTGEEVLTRMARLLADATAAERAEVWIRLQDDLRLAAAWPQQGGVVAPPSVRVGDQLLPPMSAANAIAVRHRGELLGALTVSKRQGEALKPVETKLLEDLARQAGLVLRNASLTESLRARLEDLRTSRQRLVAAQDQERRRLERNLHDGAQQHLVALKVKLSLLGRVAGDPDKVEALADQLKEDADDALDTMRDLARGIYPPLLADQGLGAALEAQVRKSTLPVVVECNGIPRFSQEVESAVYFCVLEAIQNAHKYASAKQVVVRVTAPNGQLQFEVVDDGRGFDPVNVPPGSGLQNMADRLDALGGSLDVESAPGNGTRLKGVVITEAIEHQALTRP